MNSFTKTLSILTLTFLLSACSFGGTKLDWRDLENYGTGISFVSSKIEKANLSFDNDGFKRSMERADEIAVNKGNIYTFNGEMNKVNDYFGSLRNKVVISRAIYYAYGRESDKAKFDSLYESYLSFYSWYYPFLLHVKDSSDLIYNSFFGDMNEEEVDEYIQDFLYTEQTKTLDTEIADIQDEQENKYTEFINAFRAKQIVKDDAQWNKYLNDSLNRFRDVMDKGGEYASIYGYDNYLDYVYDNYYHRDYDYTFVEQYEKLIDQYVIPASQYYDEHVDKSILSNPNKKLMFDLYTSGNIADTRCFQGDALDSYVSMMGGDMLDSYKHLKNGGYYLFSNDANSLGTAYVNSGMDDPLIFFSKNYQDVSTIVHEFGHYNAAYTNGNSNSFPFDIQETHSQGNEMLFNRYITDYYANDTNIDIYQYIQNYSVYNMLKDVLLPTAVSMVESYVFENLDKSNEYLLDGINDIMEKYRALYGEGYDLIYAYWAAPIVSSTGYYISYATSGIGAVGVYIQARQNYELAKNRYMKFVAYPEESTDIDKIFDYSGLYSPLQESTFRLLTPENLYTF